MAAARPHRDHPARRRRAGGLPMSMASDLRAGLLIRLEGVLYRLLEVTVHGATAKQSGFVHARLVKLGSGTETDRRFRPDEKIDAVELRKRDLDFSYQAGDEFYLMDPETYEQIALPADLIAGRHRFLREGLRLTVEFLDDQPVGLVFPETVELKIVSTAAPMHAHQTSTLKSAVLENGMEVQVPLFIKEGEGIRVHVATGKYVERARDVRH